MAPSSSVTPAARDLQEKLHDLLSRLSSTMDHVKDWPEAADTSVHVESTTRLIHSIHSIIAAVKRVEQAVKNNASLKEQLQSCLIPMDLLELLDVNLNPDCFSRGLLREAMGQLSGLNRRKQALEMLGSAVQKGLDERERKSLSSEPANVKRDRNDDRADDEKFGEQGESPPAKKLKVDPDGSGS